MKHYLVMVGDWTVMENVNQKVVRLCEEFRPAIESVGGVIDWCKSWSIDPAHLKVSLPDDVDLSAIIKDREIRLDSTEAPGVGQREAGSSEAGTSRATGEDAARVGGLPSISE